MLVSRGVDAKSLVVPEAGHLAQRAAYESNLRAYSDGGPRGVHAWALYGAEAFSAGAEASPAAQLTSPRRSGHASGTRSRGSGAAADT